MKIRTTGEVEHKGDKQPIHEKVEKKTLSTRTEKESEVEIANMGQGATTTKCPATPRELMLLPA